MQYEVLRFFPPIMVIQKGPPDVPRTIRVQGCDIQIPENAEISGRVFAVHFDPDYYHDLFAFQPRRWIKDATADSQKPSQPPGEAHISLGLRGLRSALA